MNTRPNLSAIAERNVALLEKINFDPQSDNPFELDNAKTFRDTGLFCEAAIDEIFGIKAADKLGQQLAVPERRDKISPTIGMVLIRPDMVQVAPEVERFIANRFEILDVSTTTVTPEVYWTMYSEAITGRETKQSRLSRAAVYVGSPCRLMTFKQPDGHTMPAADYTFANLKGKQGVEQANTLRGDIVYKEAIDAGFHTLTDPETALAVDPFGAYRKITGDQMDGVHNALTHPLLFFTGVGIHIPDYEEMQRDLNLLAPQQYSSEQSYAA